MNPHFYLLTTIPLSFPPACSLHFSIRPLSPISQWHVFLPSRKDPSGRIDFQFDEAGFDLEALPFNIPYPVPFRWLGDEVRHGCFACDIATRCCSHLRVFARFCSRMISQRLCCFRHLQIWYWFFFSVLYLFQANRHNVSRDIHVRSDTPIPPSMVP